LTGGTESSELAQLHRVFNALKGDIECFHGIHIQPVMQWVLHVLPHTAWRSLDFAPAMKNMLEYASSSQTGFTTELC
jgi:hypothetical protein